MSAPALRVASPEPGPDLGEVILLCKALRLWSHARQEGEPAQQALFALLNPRGRGLLAPVYDGLFACVEASLGRPLATGCGCTMSADEAWLTALVSAQRSDASSPHIADSGRAALIDIAAVSARIMVRFGYSGG